MSNVFKLFNTPLAQWSLITPASFLATETLQNFQMPKYANY